jgi:HlyD family secretion protein
MPKADSTLNVLIVAAVLALGVGYYVPKTLSSRHVEVEKAAITTGSTSTTPTTASTSTSNTTATPKAAAATKSGWAASAPGRVEPAGGEVRIGSQAAGRISEVLVGLNDKVGAGEILVRLDDGELIARVNAATAELAIRRRDRDGNESTGRLAQDRRAAEDSVYSAERQLVINREEYDRLAKARRTGGATPAEVDKARDAVAKGQERLDAARLAQRKALAVDNLPAPTRQEAAVTGGRAELSLAEAALERTRIRAPSAGTALQVNAKVGEMATPSPENVLVTLGNLASMQVKAELEERDVGKVRVGQMAVIRSDAFPGKDFEGKVSSMAQALGPSRIGQRGPRKPTDVDVLEIVIDLAGQTPLLPGMRVDVFLKPESAASSTLIQNASRTN